MTSSRGREIEADIGSGSRRLADLRAVGPIVDAEQIAPHLGLTPDMFWRELGRGVVYGVVERGEGEDAGRFRLTFRYRARSWSVVVES